MERYHLINLNLLSVGYYVNALDHIYSLMHYGIRRYDGVNVFSVWLGAVLHTKLKKMVCSWNFFLYHFLIKFFTELICDIIPLSLYLFFSFSSPNPDDCSKCAISNGEEKLHKPIKASPISSTCEGSLSIRNLTPLPHNDMLNVDHGSWCEKSNSLSNKSSINDENLLSSQHRNACISISVGMDA